MRAEKRPLTGLVRLDEVENIGKPIGVGRNRVNNVCGGAVHGSHFLSSHRCKSTFSSKVTKITKVTK